MRKITSRPSTAQVIRRPLGADTSFSSFELNFDSSLTGRTQNIKKHKKKPSKFDSHIINSRIGSLSISNTPRKTYKKATSPVISPRSTLPHYDNEEEPEPIEVFATLALLKTMDARNCIECIETIPVFLRALHMDGSLDPSIVAQVTQSVSGNDLQTIMCHITQEINFYNAVTNAQSLTDVEAAIAGLLPVKKASVWTRAEGTGFLFSQRQNVLLPIGSSIIGYALSNGEDIVTEDPGDHKGFNIDKDVSLFRDSHSVVLLPIKDVTGVGAAVLEASGCYSQISGSQESFSQYYIEVLKIVREIVRKRFFLTKTPSAIPSSAAKIFNSTDFESVSNSMKIIAKYIEKSVPCESCEFYRYDDRYKKIVRYNDNKEFTKDTGGIAYAASQTKDIIHVPHGHPHPAYNHEIDGRYVNRGIVARSFFTSREHIVACLRAKWNSPLFSHDDIMKLQAIVPLVFDVLKMAEWVSKTTQSINERKKTERLLSATYHCISKVIGDGNDAMEALKETSEVFFGSNKFFLSTFDGRFMCFLGTNVNFSFEKCTAGIAYNYRKLTFSKIGDETFADELYEKLNVQATNTIAFPFKMNGRVSGSIEIINPSIEEISPDVQSMFGNLCSNLLAKFILSMKNRSF